MGQLFRQADVVIGREQVFERDGLALRLLLGLLFEVVKVAPKLGRVDGARACLHDAALDAAGLEHIANAPDGKARHEDRHQSAGKGGFGEGADLSEHGGETSYPTRRSAAFDIKYGSSSERAPTTRSGFYRGGRRETSRRNRCAALDVASPST